jgi:hypothetical protein
VARFRRVLVESVTEEDVEEIARNLVKLGKAANLQALKILLPYIVDKAPSVAEAEEDGEERGPLCISFVSYIRPDGTEIQHGDAD